MSANKAKLSARGIEIGGEDATLVREVDIEISPGTTTAIVGESGSGKSLTARSLVGLLPSGLNSSGSVVLGEERYSLEANGPQTSPAWRKIRGAKITLLLQDPFTSLSPVHTVKRQVRDALKNVGHRVTPTLIEDRISEVGLNHRVLNQYPHELSGGMRQRIALVLALAADPAMLIADEPTTALDSLTQAEILGLIDTLKHARGMSVLLISHDLDVVAGHADRVEVMWAGSVVESGSAPDVLNHAVHPYTRGLLAATPRAGSVTMSTVPWRPSEAAALPTGGRWGSYADAHEIRFGPKPTLIPVVREGANASAHLVAVYDVTEHDAVVSVRRDSGPEPTDDQATHAARTTSDTVALQVTRLRVNRGNREVLHGVDLSIHRGEILGLVGQSGSGKTTLARSIAGLERPSSGTVQFDDDTDGASRHSWPQSHVQMVFQDPAGTLNPALTIRKTLVEAIRGAHSTEHSPESLLELVGLPQSLLPRRPASLSGGQRQRVAIARALSSAPKLLVCDEAVSALDMSVQAQILALLKRLRDESGQTILFITHDLAVVGQLCDRIVVLNDGEVVEIGESAQVLNRPEAEYTRELLTASIGVGQSESS